MHSLFVIVTIIYVTYCSYGFLSRKNVDFIYTNKILETAPFVDLESSQFNLAFGIQFTDPNIEGVTPALTYLKDYFEYTMTIIEWVGEDDITTYDFGFKNCEKSDFYNAVDRAFDINLLDELICPVLNESSNFTLEGTYTDDFYKFIELKIQLTPEGMNKRDKIQELMETTPIEMAVFWLDTAIDYENRKNSMPTFINYSYKNIDFDFVKTTELLFCTLEFKNDDNLLWDSTKITKDTMLDVSIDSFRYIKDRDNLDEKLIGKFVIKASSKVILVSRQYQKFPSFLADLTSLLEEILILLLLLVNFVERKAVDHKLVEKMLKFKGSKYYDIDYLINIFNKDKISNDVTEIIEKQNFERKNSIVVSRRTSQKKLLNNNLTFNDKGEKNQSSINAEFDCTGSKNLPIRDFELNVLERINEQEEKESLEHEKKEIIEKIDSERKQVEDNSIKNKDNNDILNKNAELNTSFVSRKNSIYYKNDVAYIGVTTNQNILATEGQLYKENEDKYKRLSVCEIIMASLCFWVSKKQKKKNSIIAKAQNKIHYYLDIYTYIKKMQEVDVIKYCMFDEDQLTLVKFLSKPPIKIGLSTIGSYKEFEETQIKFGKIEADQLFKSYSTLRNKNEISSEELKLLHLVKAEINFLKS